MLPESLDDVHQRQHSKQDELFAYQKHAAADGSKERPPVPGGVRLLDALPAPDKTRRKKKTVGMGERHLHRHVEDERCG